VKKVYYWPQSHPNDWPSSAVEEGQSIFEHRPVMVHEVLEYLAIKPNGIYVDGTFGRGGHSSAILQKLNDDGRLLVMDKDQDAIAVAKSINDNRLQFKHGSFTELKSWVAELNLLGKIDGIFLDLGVSSPQLDDSSRGFSFMQEGPLDMRMDKGKKLDATTWINRASEKEIAKVLKEYGEERAYRKIASKIIEVRKVTPIKTTLQLANLVKSIIPPSKTNKHPATRVFQAIRIFINDELNELQEFLAQSLDILKQGGRLVVISFHSLEYQTVRKFYYACAQNPHCQKLRQVERLIRPTDEEAKNNPRARSAMLQVMEKIV
jgi:16S rRNA (cytosine1402-N4)-methyltransferase